MLLQKFKRKPAKKRSKIPGRRKFRNFFQNSYAYITQSKYIKLLLLLLLVFGFVFLVRYLLLSNSFSIHSIHLEGNNHLSNEFVYDKISYIEEQNIFFFRSSSLESQIQTFSPYISDVRVEKHLPDQIKIYIEERTPLFVWINLSGSYIVDEEGFVVEVLSDFEDLDISSEDLDLLKGYGDLVELEEKEKEKDQKKQEDNEEEKGEEANETDELKEILEQNKFEVSSRVDTFWKKNTKSLKKKYDEGMFVYAYEVENYSVLDSLDFDIVDSTKKIIESGIASEVIKEYVWESNYRLVIFYRSGGEIVFSTRRSIEEQINELKILLNDLKSSGQDFEYIDLSSDIIVLK